MPSSTFGNAPMPYYPDVAGAPQNSIIGGASLWVMSGKKAEEYKGVAKFFSFLSDTDRQVGLHTKSGYLPITKAAYDKVKASGFYKDAPYLETPLIQLTNKEPTENSRGLRLGNMVQMRDMWAEEFESALAGKKTAKQAWMMRSAAATRCCASSRRPWRSDVINGGRSITHWPLRPRSRYWSKPWSGRRQNGDLCPMAHLKSLVPMLAVADVERTIGFYCGMLGFTCVNTFGLVGYGSPKPGWCHLKRDGVGLMFSSHLKDDEPGVPPGEKSFQVYYFYPDDIRALHAEWSAGGVPVTDLRVTGYGMREFEIRDPDGYWLWFGEDTKDPPTVRECDE